MRVQAHWTSGMRFHGANEDGLRVVMDAHPEHGGTGGGPTPMETLLLALAGCTGMDVIPMLKKMRAPVEQLVIEVTAERAPDHPKVVTAIHVRYVATGRGLQADHVEKAVALSQEKYCSVSAMLRNAATVTYEVAVIETGTEAWPAGRLLPREIVARMRMPTTLRLDQETEHLVLARLRRIGGQIGGLQRMLAEGRDCTEIAHQVAAARAALDRVALDLMAAGLERCVRMETDGKPQAADLLRKLKKTFLMLR